MAYPAILQRLHAGEILVCDGAMGTELQKRGISTGGCSEEYNVTHPDIIRAIYTDYFRAGSDMIETNTFGCNRYRLRMHALDHRLHDFCAHAVTLAREAMDIARASGRNGALYISGSVGPTGAMLEPVGDASEEDVYAAFVEQISALAAAGVDAIQIETMMAIDEALLAVRAAKDHTTLPVIATMTFEQHDSSFNTMWGVTVDDAVCALTEAGADVLGANCGNGFDEMIGIIGAMRPLTNKPILAKANAGLPVMTSGVAVYRETPETMRPKAEQLVALGVNIIGGCCGTGPGHIRALREIVDTHNGK